MLFRKVIEPLGGGKALLEEVQQGNGLKVLEFDSAT